MTADFLAELRPRLERVAAGAQSGRTLIRDDLVQEGLIEAHRALQGGETAALATWRAKRRIARLLTPEKREKWTGHVHHGEMDPGRRVGSTVALELIPDRALTEDPDRDLDVRIAVDRLPLREKEIAYRKFWLGETNAEIGEALGLSLQGVWNIWNRSIRPALRNNLCNHSDGEPAMVDNQSGSCTLAPAVGAREDYDSMWPPAPPGGQRASTVHGAAA